MYDLITIGGGPAGTAAAITAARAGAKVLLLERGRFPRHKVCGEFVSAESLSVLADLLEGDYASLLADSLRIPRARVFIDGQVLETPVYPPAASIARIDLDAALWRVAERAWVEARQQVVAHKIGGSGPFLVSTSAGEFESRALINASGRWSNLTSRAPLENNKLKWVGLKAHFAEPSPELSVDLYFFENGYCGVQAVGAGQVNACAMVRVDVASSLREVFAMHPTLRQRSATWKPLSDPVSTSPLIFRDPQPEQGGVLLVGDAAGFVDPFVGDGISLALRSGKLAAECLSNFRLQKGSLMEAVHRYRDAYGSSLQPIFRASSTIRRALRLPRAVRRPLLRLLQRTPAMTRYLVTSTRQAS
jgi:menaquinone-9 beta-reductase